MKLLDATKINDLAAALARAGYRVVAPIEDSGVVRLTEWTECAAIRTDVIGVNSVKDFLFPRSEVIGRWDLDGDDFSPRQVQPDATKTVILAVRPCDAAALALLDTIFNWDYKDDFYNARRQAATIVPMVCTAADEQCFCTSVGGAPDATAGADAMLRSADGGATFILEPLTDKGNALLDAAGDAVREGEAAADPPAEVPQRFDVDAVSQWLSENFESDL